MAAQQDVKDFEIRDGSSMRARSGGNISMPPELFEKLYLQPQVPVAGDIRQKFANPTPLYVLEICVQGLV